MQVACKQEAQAVLNTPDTFWRVSARFYSSCYQATHLRLQTGSVFCPSKSCADTVTLQDRFRIKECLLCLSVQRCPEKQETD